MSARILVVEDEETVRLQVKGALEDVGHTVVEARNGLEAEAILARETFDLVVTDLVMPERDGLELIQIVRKRFKNVKILAVSTPSTLMLLECARLLGAHATLKKPFRPDDLNRAVTNAMRPKPKGPGRKDRSESDDTELRVSSMLEAAFANPPSDRRPG